jgi:hypothetical protein
MTKTPGLPASALFPSSSYIPPRYLVGDRVEVLRACRLPHVEEVMATGLVERITESADGTVLHWISGLPAGRTVRELRLIVRGK